MLKNVVNLKLFNLKRVTRSFFFFFFKSQIPVIAKHFLNYKCFKIQSDFKNERLNIYHEIEFPVKYFLTEIGLKYSIKLKFI